MNNTSSWNSRTSGNIMEPMTGMHRGWPSLMPQTTTEMIVADVFFCLLAAMIVFGNSLMIGAFRVNRRLRTTTNLLLMSLAVADMAVGLISVPLWLYQYSAKYTIQETRINKFSIMFDVITVVSSVLHLTAISLERCYALVWPIKHRNMGKRPVIVVSCIAWILAILAGAMRKFWGNQNKTFYGITLTSVFFFLPLIIILGTYAKIFHIARVHAHGGGRNMSFRKDLRIATTVAVVIGLFVICWTPFFALNLASSVCLEKMFMSSGCQGLAKLPPVVTTATKALWYANSICNPIIYGLRNNEFRRTFHRILVALFCKTTQIVN